MSEPINTNEAAARINAIKAASKENTQPAAQNAPAAKEIANPEADAEPEGHDAEPDELDQADLNDQADDEESDAEGQDEADDESEAEGDENPVFTVKIDGEEHEVSLEELIAGYSRTGDYSKKMNALAKERKEVEALKEEIKDLPNVQKRYQESADRFLRNAQLVEVALQQRFMPPKPNPELANTNPAAYLQQKEAYQEALQFREALHGEAKKLEARQKEILQEAVQKGREELVKMVPAIKDESVRTKFKGYLNGHGFTDEMIGNEPNARLFEYAYKAMKYDEIMERKTQLSTHKTKPKLVSQRKAPPDQKAIVDRKRTQHLDRHKTEKSVNSAAAAIASLKK